VKFEEKKKKNKNKNIIILATPNSSLKNVCTKRGYCKVGRQGLVVPTSLICAKQV